MWVRCTKIRPFVLHGSKQKHKLKYQKDHRCQAVLQQDLADFQIHKVKA